jgi:CRISPR-associated endonuclease Cas2
MQYYVAAYDIANPKRLRRVARFWEQRGGRAQRSVFTFRTSPRQLERWLAQLSRIICPEADSVMVWRVHDGSDGPVQLGKGRVQASSVIIGPKITPIQRRSIRRFVHNLGPKLPILK